jgi:hypothetical protein
MSNVLRAFNSIRHRRKAHRIAVHIGARIAAALAKGGSAT